MSACLFDLLAKEPRESGGARSSNRFDCQKDWAICKLIELPDDGHDYLLLLDHHEDVVVLNSEILPTIADFFQIKTKASGNWTVHQLIKKPNSSSGHSSDSILDKLYSSQTLCGDTRRLSFESNQTRCSRKLR
jgi:hypothetical protein